MCANQLPRQPGPPQNSSSTQVQYNAVPASTGCDPPERDVVFIDDIGTKSPFHAEMPQKRRCTRNLKRPNVLPETTALDPATAIKFPPAAVDELDRWLRHMISPVNPTHDEYNCVGCSVSVGRALAGLRQAAQPVPPGTQELCLSFQRSGDAVTGMWISDRAFLMEFFPAKPMFKKTEVISVKQEDGDAWSAETQHWKGVQCEKSSLDRVADDIKKWATTAGSAISGFVFYVKLDESQFHMTNFITVMHGFDVIVRFIDAQNGVVDDKPLMVDTDGLPYQSNVFFLSQSGQRPQQQEIKAVKAEHVS
uniref:Uncharacterized protein n=1 Tax=Eutreptiella gymnastica TaxID=73025 RepID=A0A6T2FB66_9EUGL